MDGKRGGGCGDGEAHGVSVEKVMIAEILNSYDLHLTFLRNLVADLDELQMVCQPDNVPNHPAWTIGHLVHSCQQIGGEIGTPPWLPADWEERFGTGSTPVADPKAYPAKDALLSALDEGTERLRAALQAMEELDLKQPLPDVRYRDRFPTLGHAVIHILAGHTALHVGQLVVWRQVMGLGVVPEPLNEEASVSCTSASNESGGTLAEGDAWPRPIWSITSSRYGTWTARLPEFWRIRRFVHSFLERALEHDCRGSICHPGRRRLVRDPRPFCAS